MRYFSFLFVIYCLFVNLPINAQSWQTFNTSNSTIPSNSAITPFYIDNTGNKLVNLGDVYQFNGTSWTNINQGTQPRSITQDIYGNFYYSDLQYLYYKNASIWDTIYNSGFCGCLSVYSLAPDNFGNVYALIQQTGGTVAPYLYKFNQGNIVGSWQAPYFGMPTTFGYHSITVDLQGNPWFVYNSNVIKFEQGNFTVYDSTNTNMADDVIFWCINHDSQNNIWVGGFENLGNNGCIQKFDGTNWSFYNTVNSNISDDKVYDIAFDNNCNVWPLTFTKGVLKMTGNNFSTISPLSQMLGWGIYIAVDSNKIYTNHGASIGNFFSIYTDSTISYQKIIVDSIISSNNSCSDDSNIVNIYLPLNNQNNISFSIDSGKNWQTSNVFSNIKSGIRYFYIKRDCQLISKEITIPPVSNFIYNIDSIFICQGQPYLGYNSTGIYSDTLNNLNGCDTISTIFLFVNPFQQFTINQIICQGQSYLGYNSSGTYIDTFQNQYGCDSIRTLNLTVNPTQAFTINQSICQGQTYLGYNTTGTYIDTFQNQSGCDSIRTLNLLVSTSTYSTISQTICQGQFYQGYNSTGTYIDTLVNNNGCDSIRTINLTVNPNTFSSITQTICQGQSFLGHSVTGIFIDTLISSNGCDSIRILNLTVNPTQIFTINQTICQPNTFLGYNTTGTYIDTFQNQYGCDSIRTINLTVNPITTSIINQTICQPNSFLGYSMSGTFIDTLSNANGCDSVRTLNLIVNPITYSTYIDTICQGQNIFGYTTSGNYIDTFINSKGCDSIRNLQLLVFPKTYTTLNQQICNGQSYLGYNSTGTFIDTLNNVNGCDSIRTLNLIVLPNYFTDTTINLCEGDSIFCGSAWQKTTGTYWDSLNTIFGCDSVVKTNLTFSQKLNPVIQGNKEFCQGDSIFLKVNATFQKYLWSTGDTSTWIYVKNSGQYSVMVNNLGLCYGYDTVDVVVNPLPNIAIQFTAKELCQLDTIQLTATGAESYTWYSPHMSREIGNTNPIFFSVYASPVNVIVKGIDENNCSNIDSITLHYINCCGNLFIPNAFTPNGDGHNDFFKPIFNQVKYENYEIIIVNRFGQEVFKTKDLQKSWNGNFNNSPCDIGTYYYVIKAKCFENNKTQLLKGDINLIR